MQAHSYKKILENMEGTLNGLSKKIPPPKKTKFSDSFVYRYVEKTIHQAIIQKIARYITTLKAAHILLEYGFLQDQATLQRVLDELQEDVIFLSYGIIFGNITELHEKYLAAFYEEEYDPETGLPSEQNRPMIPRKKIRAYIANAEGNEVNPSGTTNAMRIISKSYSGYVHAASPHIMDMYGGNPPRFHVCGMRGTPLHEDHNEDIWNYYYRGILAFSVAAKAFGEEKLCYDIRKFADTFAKNSGKDYDVTPRQA